MVPAPQGAPNVGTGDIKSGKKITYNASTQTVGLFYPSQRQIDREKEKEEEKMAFERQMRDRRPLLTAVSPGRGELMFLFSYQCLSSRTNPSLSFKVKNDHYLPLMYSS